MSTSGLQVGDARTSTFVVEVLFCRNFSLQGDITWLEGEKTRSFRSLLEMVVLIQQACDISGAPPVGYTVRSWTEGDEAVAQRGTD